MRNAALVLSSVDADGCAHIGATKALEKNGFRIASTINALRLGGFIK